MIYPLIESRKNLWINSPDCPVKGLVSYMRKKGELRDTQIEAIETYLFFKFAGDNKPLADLFAEGFFFPAPPPNLDKMLISQRARELLGQNPAAWSLFQFSRLPDEKGNPSLPQLEKTIAEEPDSIDYREVIRKIFYGVSYPDYLFSLPMGAGKTFLIAALIYLDLYFAQQDPRDPKFAHNFLVLIPSGLKSSIAPSLKTIEQFDPTWVLPEPAASNIRRLLQFEVLDAPKSEKKSNRARNPNAQKVSMLISQPDPMGLVFLVNAEQACRLVFLDHYWDGIPIRAELTGSLCSSAIAHPLVTGRTNVTFGDWTARRMQRFGPDVIFVSVPYERVRNLVAAVPECSAGTAELEIPEGFRRR